MIKTIDMLLHEYREYSNIYNKIAFEEKNNVSVKIFQVRTNSNE